MVENQNKSRVETAPPASPKTSSPRKTAASQANGAKSPGPKTPEGKKRSSRNAIRHGLCASTFVVDSEDLQHYLDYREAYVLRFEPKDLIEHDLVEEMVQSKWMMLRSRLIHNETLNIAMMMHRHEVAERFENVAPQTSLALAFHSALKENPGLGVLLRYDAHFARQYQRALKTLLELRQNVPVPPPYHLGPDELPNEPNPISGHPAAPQHTTEGSQPPTGNSPPEGGNSKAPAADSQPAIHNSPLTIDNSRQEPTNDSQLEEAQPLSGNATFTATRPLSRSGERWVGGDGHGTAAQPAGSGSRTVPGCAVSCGGGSE